MSPQSSSIPSTQQPAEAAVPMEVVKATRPVDWETLQTKYSPSPEVAEAVKQIFEEDADILRQLA